MYFLISLSYLKLHLACYEFSCFHVFLPQRTHKDQGRNGGTLVTFLSGNSAKLVRSKSDKEIVDMCMSILKRLFPEEVCMLRLQTFLLLCWNLEGHDSPPIMSFFIGYLKLCPALRSSIYDVHKKIRFLTPPVHMGWTSPPPCG